MDFSKDGLGYCLKQKTCSCKVTNKKINLTYCEQGFRPIMCGSRFTSPAEANYAAVEGELLALSWALKMTEHFTMQNPKLVISTDHKPLVELILNTSLADLQKKNKRLARFKQRILRWDPKVVIYTPGKDSTTADALSRRPKVAAAALAASSATLRVTDDRIKEEMDKSGSMRELKALIRSGFLATKQEMDENNAKYWLVRKRLAIRKDGVITMDGRQVVPDKLHDEVCHIAHAAHQGVNTMMKNLETRVYWPTMGRRLQETRDKCDWCTRRAPSHAKLPPANIENPTRPMQSICINFANVTQTERFGVMVDRYSNWATAWSTRGTTLCRWLSEHMKIFGMPEIISTDRGTEFMAADFQALLKNNNIHHRTSSAYNPHSNNRAETGVKSMKRLLDAHAIKNNLDNPDYIRAIITHRNTPIERGMPSPNELLFGRNVPDYLPAREDGSGERLHSDEANAWEDRLRALEEIREVRQEECAERWSGHTRKLQPLESGVGVAVQNRHGNQPKWWDQKGKVVQYNGHDSYDILIEGSRRVTTRNRGHLRKLNDPEPAGTSSKPPPGGEKVQEAGGNEAVGTENAAAPAGAKERDIPAPLPRSIPTPPETTTRRTSSRTTAGKRPGYLGAYDTTVVLEEVLLVVVSGGV